MRLSFRVLTIAGESTFFMKLTASFDPQVVRTIPVTIGTDPIVVEWDAVEVEWSSCVYLLVVQMIKQKPVITGCAKLSLWDNARRSEKTLIDYSTNTVKGNVWYLFENVPHMPTSNSVAERRAVQDAHRQALIPDDAMTVLDEHYRMKTSEHYSYDDLEAFVKEYTKRLSWIIPRDQLIAEELSHLPNNSFTSLVGWPLLPHLYFRVSPAFYVDHGVFESFIVHAIAHMGATRSEFETACASIVADEHLVMSGSNYNTYLVLNVMILACSYPSLMSKYASDYAEVFENGKPKIIDTERFTILAAALFFGDCEELAKYITFMFEAARSSDTLPKTPLHTILRPIMRIYISGGALMTATLPSMDAARSANKVVSLDDLNNITGHMSSLFIQRWRIFNDDTGITDPDPPELQLRSPYPGFGEGTGDLDADMTLLDPEDLKAYRYQCSAFADTALGRWDRRLPNTAEKLDETISVNNFYRYLFLFLPCSRQPLPVTFFLPVLYAEEGEFYGCTVPDLLSGSATFRPAHVLDEHDTLFTQIILNHLPGETGPEAADLSPFLKRQFEEFNTMMRSVGLTDLDTDVQVKDGFRRVVLHKAIGDITEDGFHDSVLNLKQLGVKESTIKYLALSSTRALVLLIFDLPDKSSFIESKN